MVKQTLSSLSREAHDHQIKNILDDGQIQPNGYKKMKGAGLTVCSTP